MTSAVPLEIIDLRHYSASHLRPILDRESLLWRERLHWDFRASADLLLKYLDTHVLPGYIAMEKGEVSGYTFCVYEESKAVIGDVFASPEKNRDSTPTEIENRLIIFLIELLQNSPGVNRIESQLLLHPHGTHQAAFHHGGFQTYTRLFMHLDLKAQAPSLENQAGTKTDGYRSPASPTLPHNLELRRWQDSDFNPAGRLIAAAYEHHLDSRINDQYRTVAGSLRFLHNIVRFPGCGIFDPTASFVITRAGSEDLAGLLLCSRISQDAAHVTQICVAAHQRARGLATRLLAACIDDLTSRGVNELTLTVTEGNTGAVSLYIRQGFHQTHTFDAMVWERTPTRPQRSRAF